MLFKKQPEVVTDETRIDEVLNRGVIVEFYPSKEEFKAKLLSGERLKMYWGFDATSTQLHLSHAKNFLLLEDFRSLGHETIVVFGDFTALIGDPSDRSSARSRLTRDDVRKNVKSWLRQIEPLMGFSEKVNPPVVAYNSEWLKTLHFEEVIDLASNFTVQQMLERDMFEKRMKANQPIHLHEFLYPLMQGYDNIVLDVDVELGGTDQIFNMLAGRTLMSKVKDKNKFVVAVNLMANPKTGNLMSKSDGTGVFLGGTPEDMYGSIMAQPDEMTEIILVNNTRISLGKIKEKIDMDDKKKAKMFAASEVVKIFYGVKAAVKSEEHFVATFSDKKVPNDVQETKVAPGSNLMNTLRGSGVVKSNSEYRRLVKEGAISDTNTGDKITNENHIVARDTTFKVGKRRFIKVVLRD